MKIETFKSNFDSEGPQLWAFSNTVKFCHLLSADV